MPMLVNQVKRYAVVLPTGARADIWATSERKARKMARKFINTHSLPKGTKVFLSEKVSITAEKTIRSSFEKKAMIRTVKKHYVVFHSPGTFVDESSRREIDSWSPQLAAKLASEIKERHGAKPYGFRFETYLEADSVSDSNGNTLEVKSKKIAESDGTYFLGGKIETYDDVVRRATKEDRILISNMECNGYWTVITNTNSYKTTRPFGLKDTLVDSDGRILCDGINYSNYHDQMEKKSERK